MRNLFRFSSFLLAIVIAGIPATLNGAVVVDMSDSAWTQFEEVAATLGAEDEMVVTFIVPVVFEDELFVYELRISDGMPESSGSTSGLREFGVTLDGFNLEWDRSESYITYVRPTDSYHHYGLPEEVIACLEEADIPLCVFGASDPSLRLR